MYECSNFCKLSVLLLLLLTPSLAMGGDDDDDADSCEPTEGRFRCGLGDCIDADQVCTGSDDCLDGADEGPWCRDSCPPAMGCQQECMPTPSGGTCYCRRGYGVSGSDPSACQDVDECATHAACSQLCANTPGSFSCSCAEGYSYRNPMGGSGASNSPGQGMCYASGSESTKLFYATKNKIHLLEGHTRGGRPSFSVSNVFPVEVHGAIALGYDSADRRVYWTSTDEGAEGVMYTDLLHGNRSQYLVRGEDFHLPEGLAVDYVGRNVYFTDSHADTDGRSFVGVASVATGRWAKLIEESRWLDKPRGIAVYPPRRLLFFTDWGRNAAIVRANMDGGDVRAVVTKDPGQTDAWINDLAVDVVKERIYWVDAHSDKIESVRFDGSGRTVILEEMARHPFYLETFEGWLYWTDWRTGEIHFCNKLSGADMGSVFEDENDVPMGISVHHPLMEERTRLANPCAASPCSHICVLSPAGYACLCPERLSHGETCRPESVAVTTGAPVVADTTEDQVDRWINEGSSTTGSPPPPTPSWSPMDTTTTDPVEQWISGGGGEGGDGGDDEDKPSSSSPNAAAAVIVAIVVVAVLAVGAIVWLRRREAIKMSRPLPTRLGDRPSPDPSEVVVALSSCAATASEASASPMDTATELRGCRRHYYHYCNDDTTDEAALIRNAEGHGGQEEEEHTNYYENEDPR